MFWVTTGGGFGFEIASGVMAVGVCDSLTMSIIVVPFGDSGFAGVAAGGGLLVCSCVCSPLVVVGVTLSDGSGGVFSLMPSKDFRRARTVFLGTLGGSASVEVGAF